MSKPPTTIYMPNDLEDEVEKITLPARRVYFSAYSEVLEKLCDRLAGQLPSCVKTHTIAYPPTSGVPYVLADKDVQSSDSSMEAMFILGLGEHLKSIGPQSRNATIPNLLSFLKSCGKNMSIFFFDKPAGNSPDPYGLYGSIPRLAQRYTDVFAYVKRSDLGEDLFGHSNTLRDEPNEEYLSTLLYVCRKCVPERMTFAQAVEEYAGDFFYYLYSVWLDLFGDRQSSFDSSKTSQLVTPYLKEQDVSPALLELFLGKAGSLNGKVFREIGMFSCPQFYAALEDCDIKALLDGCNHTDVRHKARSNPMASARLEAFLKRQRPL